MPAPAARVSPPETGLHLTPAKAILQLLAVGGAGAIAALAGGNSKALSLLPTQAGSPML